MNVLHLRSSGGFYGAEQVILNLARELNRLGCTNHVVCLNNTYNPHLELIEVATHAGVSAFAIDCRGLFDRVTIGRIREIVRTMNIDVVHCHDYKTRFFGLCALRGSRARKIATNHLWPKASLKGRLYETLDGLLLNGFDKVVAVSALIEDECRPFMLNERKLACIPNGIDPTPFVLQNREERRRGTRDELGLDANDLVIGNIARLSVEKDQATLLRAVKRLIDGSQTRSIKMVVVGDGPEDRNLAELAAGLGIGDRCLFTGVRTDIPEILNCIDVYVQSSRREGLPMIILEAMAAAAAIVSTKAGAIPTVISDREEGRLVEIGDTEGMARVLEEVLSDAGERRRLGQRARHAVETRFSARAMASQYLSVYKPAS